MADSESKYAKSQRKTCEGFALAIATEFLQVQIQEKDDSIWLRSTATVYYFSSITSHSWKFSNRAGLNS